MATQEGEGAKFEGFINLLHFLGLKTIRGYMGVPEKFRKTGFVVQNGRVQRVKTHEEQIEDAANFLSSFCQYAGIQFGPDSSNDDSENATP